MLIALHKNAATAPAIREAIRDASDSDYVLGWQFHVCCDTVQGANDIAHRLLDDLLAVIQEFIERAFSRSALDHLLRRPGSAKLPVSDRPANTTKPFKDNAPGYLHNDVKHLPQRALNHATSVQVLKQWQNSHPDLFSQAVRNYAHLTINFIFLYFGVSNYIIWCGLISRATLFQT